MNLSVQMYTWLQEDTYGAYEIYSTLRADLATESEWLDLQLSLKYYQNKSKEIFKSVLKT